MVEKIKEYITRCTKSMGFDIVRTEEGRVIRNGLYFCDDVKKRRNNIATIMDVGAHHGRSAIHFRNYFPNASIYCFEPVDTNYEKLEKKAQANNIHTFNVGLSNTAGTKPVSLSKDSKRHSLRESSASKEKQEAEFTTVDQFIKKVNIDSIDILKIDAEGHDIQILKGAQELMTAGKISFIIVEASLQEGSEYFCDFIEVRDVLADKSFEVMGVYDQTLNQKKKHRPLLFANIAFVHM